ncbi:nuclear transport factor 2 family protein [Rhodococcus sp. ACS1]|uniref:nuclear transport factor 2 family protein n=1 Tax=Rhodococcus sp. ACS1 TaxID=2028570 RepID=UPI00211D0DD7|nr:nuclear transport factor 2 family protein [Rhodococcus sp. ACS1]
MPPPGDRDTIESILGPDFKHITSEGQLLGRDEEIASIVPVAFTMNATEQTVDIVDDTAEIHGVNTLTESGIGRTASTPLLAGSSSAQSR